MKRAWLLLLLACKSQPGVTTATSAAPTVRVVPPAKAGPATHVVELAPNSPTPIMRGPFEVTTINPAGDLELGIAKDESCAGVAWFVYSGGGAAVSEGEILCARSGRSRTITQGFSGH
ncbi:MAG: hypothetical protein M4D80_04260 [Myxococcota bacterium]|nr:hypothetical protein [Myxococcota bacterium]